ncbi:hypothetical protein CMUS01_10276 [Colletotrichum musicola]|uniref:Fungal N-terminal domain-containing protein n=1 Tax=Colletotrichum musicola TaxID=2175873 RepID=A0A8H6N9F8_9PEZI|nr:hypothetical protein CMUS01_10276 [Colletotrichum musicola]
MATGSKVVDILKTLSDSSKGIDERIRALIDEVETFNRVLGLTRATLESQELRPPFHSTGHLADHWRNIAACIRDGEKSMADFASALEKVDKSVRFMDSARKALRLKAALDDVAAFQRRLSSCRDTIQLSLQAALL